MFRGITFTLGLLFLFVTGAVAQSTSEKIKVVATIFPNYDFTKEIGKDKVDVVKLLPPGVEAHGFEPRPKDVVTINKADIFVYTGEFMEPWAEDIIGGVTNKKLVVVDASKGIELMDEADHGDHGGHGHHGGEHGFEWAGAFHLPVGKYVWTFAKVDGDYADPAMKMVFVASTEKGIEAIETKEETAEKLLEMESATARNHGEMLSPNDKKAYKLTFDQNREVTEFTIDIKKEGVYAFFTEHMPFEFEADEHFLKNSKRQDVEPVAQEPDAGHDHHDHGGHGHHGGEHGFEWAGAFDLAAGKYVWTFAKVDGDYADPAMKMVFVSSAEKGIEAIESQEEAAEKMLEMKSATARSHGEMLSPNGKKAFKLNFDQNREVTEFPIVIKKAGVYAFYTEHMPFEFEADEHFLKDARGKDVEPVAQEPDAGHDHHHGGKDPHIWVDLAYAQQMVDTIAQALGQKDPGNKDFYFANAKEYKAKLAALDGRFSKTLANCKHDTIIYGGHFAFGYFAKRYNLGHESPYEGFAPNAQPSPKAIAELVDKVEASGIKYIYHEELLDPKVARTVSRETGVELELLHGAHNVSKDELKAGVTYLDIMNDNYDKLKVGLECQ